MAQACADTIAFYVQWQKPCADISFPNYPLLTDHFPLCLTAPYSLPIVPSRDPESFFRERPPYQPLCGCACKRPLCGCAWIVKDRFRFMARGNFGERLKRERELREV